MFRIASSLLGCNSFGVVGRGVFVLISGQLQNGVGDITNPLKSRGVITATRNHKIAAIEIDAMMENIGRCLHKFRLHKPIIGILTKGVECGAVAHHDHCGIYHGARWK
jgi:hypothetical protein